MSNSPQFDDLLVDSFNKFRNDDGAWKKIVLGPCEMIIGYYIYMLRIFFDEYSEKIFTMPADFLTNLRAGNGVNLIGSDKIDIYPCIKMGVPVGRLNKMELGEASANADINYTTHDRWVGTINFTVKGRKCIECVKLSDILVETLKGPLLNTQRALSIYMGSIQTSDPTEKKISNDIVAWENRITINLEIVTMGALFEVLVPMLEEIEVIMTVD